MVEFHQKSSPFRKRLLPYLVVSPYLLHLFLFVLFPVVFSIVLTFHKWNIISPMQFVGLDNFVRLFEDRLFWKAILNTLLFLLVHIPLQIAVALALAYFLTQKIFIRGFFRASFFLPVVISGVVVTILWQQLYGLEAFVRKHKLRLNKKDIFDAEQALKRGRMALVKKAKAESLQELGEYLTRFHAHLSEKLGGDGALGVLED